MRKLRSFAFALVLFLILVACIHIAVENTSLKMENGRFGFWSSPYKNMSFSAISENITESAMLVMGSSEFNHGRDSDFHPRKMLSSSSADIITLGSAGNQILFHSIALGSLEKNIKNRKAVLLVSPTWFRKDGVTKSNYTKRFSESEYIMFMENESISPEIKKYVAERSAELLSDDPNKKSRAEIIHNAILNERRNIFSRILYGIERFLTFERDRVSAAFAIRDIIEMPDIEMDENEISEESFDMSFERAEKRTKKSADNPFSMRNSNWERKYLGKYKKEKDAHNNSIHIDSKEFDDFEAFLRVCKDTGVKVKLVIMPVNGKWFDYIGSGRKQRREVTDKIIEMAEKYDTDYADLTVHEYEPYITKDATHPWSKGWVLINKEIFEYCEKD